MKMTLGRTGLTTLIALGLAGVGVAAQANIVFTAWDFNNNPNTPAGAATNTSPTASVGSGTALSIGMTNTYGTPGPSTDISDVLETTAVTDQGSSDSNQATGNVWRIRGGKGAGTTAANGWSSLAPEYTQGAEFFASTVGYTNIGISYDWDPTAQGVGDLQLQYTTDGSTWTNAGGVLSSVAANGGHGAGWYNQNLFDFSSITAANNDPNFGIRMVSSYDPTVGLSNGQPAAYVNATGGTLNNTSGNWRFDEVQINGLAAAPEPSEYATMSLVLLGLVALGLRARKRQRASD